MANESSGFEAFRKLVNGPMSAQPEFESIAELVARKFGLHEVSFCGKGSFKETYRAIYPDGITVALKLIDRAMNESVRTQREIAALKRCDSLRIAKVLEAHTFSAPDARVFDVVLEEFFPGGSLEDRLRANQMTCQQIIDLTVGLLLAVNDLHALHLVHRDIKPANVMFRDGSPQPVLVDFGLVRDLNQTSLTPTWLPWGPGTPFYASPEQLNNEKVLIDWRSDQFSIGVVAGHLLTGQHPYQPESGNPSSAIQAALERRGPSTAFRQSMDTMGLSAVTRMVSAWPVQRFSEPSQVLAEFNS